MDNKNAEELKKRMQKYYDDKIQKELDKLKDVLSRKDDPNVLKLTNYNDFNYDISDNDDDNNVMDLDKK